EANHQSKVTSTHGYKEGIPKATAQKALSSQPICPTSTNKSLSGQRKFFPVKLVTSCTGHPSAVKRPLEHVPASNGCISPKMNDQMTMPLDHILLDTSDGIDKGICGKDNKSPEDNLVKKLKIEQQEHLPANGTEPVNGTSGDGKPSHQDQNIDPSEVSNKF